MRANEKALAAQVALFTGITALSLLAGILLAAPTYAPASLFLVTLLSGAGFFVAAIVGQRVHDQIIRAGLEKIRAQRPAQSGAPGR